MLSSCRECQSVLGTILPHVGSPELPGRKRYFPHSSKVSKKGYTVYLLTYRFKNSVFPPQTSRARNQPAQPPAGGRLPPFDHKTGEGHVPFHGGDYHDARYKKRNQVVPLIVEALGGIGRRGARCLRFLARRASCRKRGRDGTTCSRFHPSNYLSHHLAGIVTAAVFSDAAHIVEEIALLKTRTSGATRTAAAANPIE